METSIRLVWKDVVVDQKRALSILDLLVLGCPEVRLLEQKAKGYSAANEWRACFRDFAYKSDQPVRMVFNDSVSQAAPLFRPEKRPLDLFCIYELTHNQGILDQSLAQSQVEYLMILAYLSHVFKRDESSTFQDEIKVFSRGMEVSSEDYQTLLKCTSIRQSRKELTEYQQPRRSHGGNSGGRVRIRTRNGRGWFWGSLWSAGGMATNSHDLLSKVKQRFPQVKFPADAAETLERVQKFLTDLWHCIGLTAHLYMLFENLVQIQNDATHQVLGNYADWWESWTKDKQGAKFLAISEEYNVEELNKCIATKYELGAPLTLGLHWAAIITVYHS
eukprot:g23705.t1